MLLNSPQPHPAHSNVLAFGPFLFDSTTLKLRKHGVSVRLRGQPLQILALLHRPNQIITRQELQLQLWRGSTYVDFEHGLNAAINRLRQVLGDSADNPRYIETVPGQGYIFVAPVLQPEAKPILEVNHLHAVVHPQPAIPPRRNFSRLWTIAACLACLATFGFLASRSLSSSSSPPYHSLAILPIVNASGDNSLEYVSDGLSEHLINRLSLMPGLRIIARGSSFRYKGGNRDLCEVSRALDVKFILDGRLTQHGGTLQVRVDLVDAATQTHLWGEHYSAKSADILFLHEQIARDLAEKLRPSPLLARRQPPPIPVTRNPEAYRLYLTALYNTRKNTLESLRKALDYFQQTIALDPGFVVAYAGMIDVYANLQGAGALDSRQAMENSKIAAHKALELDDQRAEVHGALAIIQTHEWHWAEAEREYKRALELNPNLAGVHSDYSIFLCQLGRFSEAIAENHLAQNLSPLSVSLKDIEGRILIAAHLYDEARTVLLHLREMEPNAAFVHLGLAQAYFGMGMFADAISEYRITNNLFGDTPIGLLDLGYAYAVSGNRAEALAILQRLQSANVEVSPSHLAALHVGLGNKAHALDLLERGFVQHDPQLINLKINHRFESLHPEPRFQAVLRRVGLAN